MEERGNMFQRFITEAIILCHPKITNIEYKKFISKYGDKLIYIQKNDKACSVDDYIPCLFYRKKESNNFLIYFHGNSENIFQIGYYGLDFRSYLEMNVILVEYPGYFLKNKNSSDPNIFFSNSTCVYDWVKSTFKVSDEQIFVCGRSLGTSPAIYLSSHRNPKALFLISAFTSIKNVGSDKCLSIFLEKIFKSIDYIENVKCSILFIHGLDDNLISYEHSEALKKKAEMNNKNKNKIDIKFIENRNHNNLELKNDIIDNIIQFCTENKLVNNKNKINNMNIIEDSLLYQTPIKIKKLLEEIIFDINDFEIEEKKEKKNVSILIGLNKDRFLAISQDSFISIYNDCFLLDYEIKLGVFEKIKSLYQDKNGNLICATKEGVIYIFKINKKNYELIKSFHIGEEIYKIGEFFDDNVCLLSKSLIQILDNTFTDAIVKINNKKEITNFSLFRKNRLAFIKKGLIFIAEFEKNKKQINFIKDIKIEDTVSVNTLVGTEQFLIIGDIGKINFYNIEKNYKIESRELELSQQTFEKITFISKIHDQLLLATTNKGSIIQIIINDDDSIIIRKKFIDLIEISSILMIDYKTLLIAGDDQINILYIPSLEDKKGKNCMIF